MCQLSWHGWVDSCEGIRLQALTAHRVDGPDVRCGISRKPGVVACAATLWTSGQTTISDAGDAARALGPLAGSAAEALFAFGLLAASLLGLGTVPLTSTYAACEAFGWEAGLDDCWGEAPASYGLLAFFVGFAALFVLIPGLPLITVIFLSQVFDGLLLPIILVFVMLLARDRNLMGELVSS